MSPRPSEPEVSGGEGDLGRGARGYGVRTAWFLGVTMIYIFLIAPILIVVLTSFSASALNALPTKGLSLRWYVEFVNSDAFTSAFGFSLTLAAFASVGATAIGFLTAYGLLRFVGRRRELGQALAFMPMMIPHLLIGISLVLALSFIPFPEMVAFIIGHIIIALPFTIAAIMASLVGVDATMELAAMTLGASRPRAVWEIVIPLIGPGLLSALLFAFIVSFGDVYISLFLAVPGMTPLPIEIFSFMQWESTPVVAAITTIQVLMIVAFGLVIEHLIGLRKVLRV